jgi:hypothetical protein
LPGEPDNSAHLGGVLDDVVTGDAGPAGVGAQQGGQDPDGGRLAGAVRSEHAQDGALTRGEADPVKGLGGAEALGQSLGLDGVGHRDLLECVFSRQECVRALTSDAHRADTKIKVTTTGDHGGG